MGTVRKGGARAAAAAPRQPHLAACAPVQPWLSSRWTPVPPSWSATRSPAQPPEQPLHRLRSPDRDPGRPEMIATGALLRVLLLLLAFGHSTYGAECDPPCDPQYGFCEADNVCRCHVGWEGPLCDKCVTAPGCVNGVCKEPWQCICKDGWDGKFCEIDVRACTSTPCANNGTCVDLEKGQYECSCTPGFSGKDCQHKAGPCVINGSPCQHGGACVDDEGQASHASCLCPPGFSGPSLLPGFLRALYAVCAFCGGVCSIVWNRVNAMLTYIVLCCCVPCYHAI